MIPLDPERSLQITRVLSAPPQRVFDAWVIPALRKRWFGAADGDRCTLCEIDPRVGGKYRVNMVRGDQEYIARGEFREFVRPERLVFTWSWEKPSDGVQNSVVTLEFKALPGAKTEMTLTHTGFANSGGRDRHTEGWTGCAAHLADMLVAEGFGDANHYTADVTLDAPPVKVFDAITSSDGLKAWWMPSTDSGSGVGAEHTFRFGKNFHTVRVDKLEPDREVAWTCVAQHNENFHPPDEWVGTSMLFQLHGNPQGGTDLHFEHEGLTTALECYERCNSGWDHYLRESLKQYVETGQGKPWPR